MANSTRLDKFGNEYMVVGCKDKKGSGYSKGYVEIKGQLYKLEPSQSQKEGTEMWIKITKMNKQKRSGQF